MNGPWIVAFVAVSLAALVALVLVLGLIRQLAGILERVETLLLDAEGLAPLHGLPVGSPLPSFQARTAAGGTVSDADVRGHPGIFLFLDVDCAPCRTLLDELSHDGPPLPVPLYVLVERATDEHGRLPPWIVTISPDATSLPRAFRSSVRPNAIAFDARGTVVERAAPNSIDHLREMAGRITIAEAGKGRGRSEHQRGESTPVEAVEGSETGGSR
jgi:hypothetical protein